MVSFKNKFSIIDLKFLLKGHSFMHPDGTFGRIQNAAKTENVWVPTDYSNIILNSGASATEMKNEDFINIIPLVKGLFTTRKYDSNNEKLDKITTYAWFRFMKNEKSDVIMMVRKELNEDTPWRNVSIEKEKSRWIYDKNDLERLYCRKINNNWVAQRREIKLAKIWNIYDLTQKFYHLKHNFFIKN